jgi:hypothetical protein
VAAAGEVAVHDVEPGAVVELGVLEAFGGVELAVAGRGVVEELGEGPDDVVVVVEGLVVVAADAAVALDEDLAGGVDLDLPDLGVGEQVGEGLGDRGCPYVAEWWWCQAWWRLVPLHRLSPPVSPNRCCTGESGTVDPT